MTTTEAFFLTSGICTALPALCRWFHVRRLYLFGSAATGQGFDPARCDLDFLVDFEPLPPAEYADAYFGLREALSGRPIDLVTEPALENPFFRRQVEAERRLLFQAP